MYEVNYLSYEPGGIIQLHGFDKINEVAYVWVSVTKRTLAIETRMYKEKENCFKIIISEQRTIKDARLFRVLNRNQLFNKRFVYNGPRENYFSTTVSI